MFDFIKSIQSRDAANPTTCEVLFAYNGFHAVMWHRMSHTIWGLGLRALARFSANVARIFTGIEIHPAATIGKNLFIDHGTGVVIGQTTIIKDDVTIYQNVTLGGVGRTGEDPAKRHPVVENGAMIGAGAQVLGGITIGAGAKVGANSVVVSDIPPGCTAIGIPARVICKDDSTHRAYGMPSRADMETLSNIWELLNHTIEAEKRKKAPAKKSTASKKNS